MVTIYPNVLLRRVQVDKTKGGILLPDPADRLVECSVVRNVVWGSTAPRAEKDESSRVYLYANSKVFIRAKTPTRGSWEDADLYLVDDIVASA